MTALEKLTNYKQCKINVVAETILLYYMQCKHLSSSIKIKDEKHRSEII